MRKNRSYAAVGLLLALLSSTARAGYYKMTSQSGGTATSSGSSVPYGPLSDGTYDGSTATGGYAATADCSGAITTVFEWQRDYTGDDPPASAVVREECLAEAHSLTFNGGSGSATADNGLGSPKHDTATTMFNGLVSYDGNCQDPPRYTVQGGQTVTVTCSPQAHATTNNGPANASVSYSVAVGAVLVTVNGTIPGTDPTYDNILAGQRATGYLVCQLPEVAFGGHSWEVPGYTYARWDVASGETQASVASVPSSEWSQAVPAWRWYRKPDDSATYTVSCTATAYDPDGKSIGSVSAQRKVKAWEPYWSFANTKGTVSYSAASGDPNSGSDDYVHAGAPGISGMRFDGRVATPFLFYNYYQAAGDWEFGQLINVYRDLIIPGYDGMVTATYGYWLDNAWPYPYGSESGTGGPAIYDAIPVSDPSYPGGVRGTEGITGDSPGQGIAGTTEYVCNDQFKMYQTYYPPENDNGTDDDPASDWVPLEKLAWLWYAHDTRSQTTDPYPTTHPGYTDDSGGYTIHPEFPSWFQKFANTP